jgi:hypothetical protein
VTPPSAPTPEIAAFPERGTRVLLDGLPGGPWSSVIEGLNDRTLTLDAPRLGGKVVALPLKRRFIVAYSLREIPCEIDAELVGAPTSKGGGGYTAEILGDPRRMQRRRAVRVPVHLIARVALDDGDEKKPDAKKGDGKDDESVSAITEDLSAGGVLLRLVEPINAGSPITTTILCGGDAGAMEIHGRVIRCDQIDTEERPYRAAVAFVDLSRTEEDRLVRFVFEKQREMRRREAGLA